MFLTISLLVVVSQAFGALEAPIGVSSQLLGQHTVVGTLAGSKSVEGEGTPTRVHQGRRITGRVVDTAGNPLADVSIVLDDVERGGTTALKTDDDGTFFRMGLRPGRYLVRYEKDGYVPIEIPLQLRQAQTTMDAVMEAVIEEPPPGPDSSPEYVKAFQAFQAEDYAEAIRNLEPLTSEHMEFLNGFILLGRAHIELENWEGAVKAYERVVELNPGIFGVHLELGMALVRSGEIGAGTPHFEAALQLQPDNAETLYNIGAVYFRANEVELGIARLREALDIEPDHILTHKALGFALARAEQTAEAITHLERYLELAPEAPDAELMTQLLADLRKQEEQTQ